MASGEFARRARGTACRLLNSTRWDRHSAATRLINLNDMPDLVATSNGSVAASALPARPLPAAKPSAPRRPILRWVGRLAGIAVTLLILTGGAVAFRAQQEKKTAPPPSPGSGSSEANAGVKVVSADTVAVAADVQWSLGIKTGEVTVADKPRPLAPLQGILNADLNRTIPVHSAFAGIVVAIGTVDGGETEKPTDDKGSRALRQWDKVKENQLLAVVWSKDLGEKKSELVQAISDLKAAKDQLNRYESLEPGIVPGKDVIAARFAVRTAENSVNKAESTLRAWRLPDTEIKALIAEAEKLGTPEARREFTSGKTWARVEIRAPFAGSLLEKNVNIGSVVDTTATLFQVVDLSRLVVAAQAYEEDLPMLQDLMRRSGRGAPWQVRIPARPEFVANGTLEQIGELIDQTMHTALVTGTVDNPDGELKAGQFVTVTIAVPPRADEYLVPTQAVVEDGKTSVVFVQPDPNVPKYVRKAVRVVRRYHDACYVKAEPDGVQPGEMVVTGGALQLNQALTDAPQADVAKK
jgi:membrane fusion protein, heavy metal efflux system